MITPFNGLSAPIAIFAVILMACSSDGGERLVREDGENIRGVSESLMSLIEAATPRGIKTNQNGDLVHIYLPTRLNTDSNLDLIASCSTVTNVTIWFTQESNRSLSKAGFDSLRKLPRLERLEVGCCKLIPSDMFVSICQLTNLRTLRLNRAEPSVENYIWLTNLTRLEELHIGEAKNFGDPEFERLNILSRLRKVTLYSPSVSNRCLDAASSFPSLTNLIVTRKVIGAGSKMEQIEWSKFDWR